MGHTTLIDPRERVRTTMEEPNPTSLRKARIVGVLFIVATAAAAASVAALGSVLDGPLSEVLTNETMVITAVLLDFITAGAVVAISLVLFSVLKRDNESLALSYVVTRALEGIVIVAGAVGLLSLLSVSQELSAVGKSEGLEATGTLLQGARDWTDLVGTQLLFAITALILNYSFYGTKLVPRWISIWGFAGAALALTVAIAGMFVGLDPLSTASVLSFLPIAINEMVLAVWLIVKGFSQGPSLPSG